MSGSASFFFNEKLAWAGRTVAPSVNLQDDAGERWDKSGAVTAKLALHRAEVPPGPLPW